MDSLTGGGLPSSSKSSLAKGLLLFRVSDPYRHPEWNDAEMMKATKI